jgi:hypothetical protein
MVLEVLINFITAHDTRANRAGVRNVEMVLTKMSGEVCDEAARALDSSGLEAAQGTLDGLLV